MVTALGLVAAAGFSVAPSTETARAAIAATCKVIVTNNSDQTRVIDVLTSAVSIFPSNGVGAGGPTQYGSAFDRTGTKLYVANSDNTINVFDSTQYGKITTITQSAYALASSPIRDEMYVADYVAGELVKIDSVTDATVSAVSTGVNSADVIVSRDGTYAYVANSNNVPGSISRVNTSTFTAISRTVTGAGVGNTNPNGLSISPDGSRLFFAGPGDDRLVRVLTSEFNNASVDLTSGVTVGDQNYQTAITSDGSRIFVASSLNNAVYVVDSSTLQISATIPVGAFPLDLAISPDDTYLYVANLFSSNVSKIRLSDYTVTTIAIGAGPSGLAIGGPGCWPQPQAGPPPAPVSFVPLYRATLNPNGGTCIDSASRTETWTTSFVGYRYLPGSTDCTRPGYAFGGWANTSTPTIARTFPLLTDPADNTQRYFVADNLDLVAVWKPLPTVVSDLVVFANFFCGPCTNAWLIHTPSEHATSYDYTLNSTPATCSPSVTVLGLHACQLTSLTAGTPLTATVTPRNTDGTGPSTTTTFTLRR